MKRKILTSFAVRWGTALLILVVFALWLRPSRFPAKASEEEERENVDWRHYGNDLANTRFQNVDQINRSNVDQLQVAWVFHTGVLDPLANLERSEEHTSELQSPCNLVCRLLLEKKKTKQQICAYRRIMTAGLRTRHIDQILRRVSRVNLVLCVLTIRAVLERIRCLARDRIRSSC